MQVNVGNLPIWKGIQDEPGFTRLPFIFGINQGLIRLTLSKDELYKISESYSYDAYNFITSPPGTSSWGNRLGNWYFDMLAQQVGNLSGKSVLEVGSGTTYIAERVINELYADQFIACDPTLRSESRNERIKIIREYFSYQLFDKKAFDLIILLNTLEHILDPFEHLKDIRRLLEEKNGLLYLVVPDCTRQLLTGDIGVCTHEHLSYFVPDTFRSVLEASGFTICWLYSREDTLFASARPALQAPINRPDPFDFSKALLSTFKSHFEQNLEIAQELIFKNMQNSRLAIHGCGVGLNNILGLLEISSHPNIFLFDGDSKKVGKYLPAFDKPILSANDDIYKTMETVIVAALTYYDEISRFALDTHNIPPGQIYPIMPLGENRDN